MDKKITTEAKLLRKIRTKLLRNIEAQLDGPGVVQESLIHPLLFGYGVLVDKEIRLREVVLIERR